LTIKTSDKEEKVKEWVSPDDRLVKLRELHIQNGIHQSIDKMEAKVTAFYMGDFCLSTFCRDVNKHCSFCSSRNFKPGKTHTRHNPYERPKETFVGDLYALKDLRVDLDDKY
jgi:hypothetical protein